MMVEPPKCPNCGEPLLVVTEETPLVWSEESEKYSDNDSQAIGVYVCNHCKKAIGGWRADGEAWGFSPEVD